MKKLKKIMLLVMTFSLSIFSSCSSDDDATPIVPIGPNSSAGQGIIVAKVDGVDFSSLEITSYASKSTGGGQTTLVMQGNTQSQAINMIINAYDGVGTYELSDDNVFRSASYIEPNISDPFNSQTWNAPYQDSGLVGEIVITEDSDTKVIGTFYFTCKNANDNSIKNITDGAFDLNYQ
ncbi:DUF6252 family protein [Corallibacter sp.]|uniref:DUF6252 family protein n=1 Tax=Corallibacter sp. TaxID=2038084 RepID=UPI003AB50F18